MSRKFCPKCGKATEKFYGSLCSDCFLQDKSSIAGLPESIVARVCRICGRYYSDDKQSSTLDGAVEEGIKYLFKKNKKVVSIDFRTDSRKNKVYVTVKSGFDGLEKEETREFYLVLKTIMCQYCAMKNTGYYQTILQVRLPKELMEAVIDEIVKQLSICNQSNMQAFVSKIERKKEGVDLYIGSKKAANDIVNMLRREVGIKTKFSKKLAGKLKGENAYRDTILITV